MRLPVLWLILTATSTMSAEGQQISLRLFVPESTNCTGTKELEVRLELQNVGQTSLEINTGAVGRSFDAIAIYSTESNMARFESLQVTGDRITRPTGRVIVLRPGATHAFRGTVILDDKFFAEPGFYKVRTDFSQQQSGERPGGTVHANSNWVILQVVPCTATIKPPP